MVDNNAEAMSDDDIYDVLDTGEVLTALDGLMLSWSKAEQKYLVTGLDYGNSITVYRWLLPILCGPGKMAPFATPLAATYDPIFWPSHNAYERLWAWKRIHPDSAFSNLWKDDNSTCYGHNLHDSLPWSNFLDEGTDKRYTNQQLLELFDPRNPKLPHVFDTFAWEHCHFDWEAHPTHKPTMAPTVNKTFRPTGPTFAPTRARTPKPSSPIWKTDPLHEHPKGPAHDPYPGAPTPVPTNPTSLPTATPTPLPTYEPTPGPSGFPTYEPTSGPSAFPTYEPTLFPTPLPSYAPTLFPTPLPSYAPTSSPNAATWDERQGDDSADSAVSDSHFADDQTAASSAASDTTDGGGATTDGATTDDGGDAPTDGGDAAVGVPQARR